MSVIINHLSDTHGNWPGLHGRADCTVHSGDLCPNFTFGKPDAEYENKKQTEWVKDNLHNFEQLWMPNDVPLIIIPGNHDYVNVAQILLAHGLNAVDICEKPAFVAGLNFYGFPWVPANCMPWNFVLSDGEMRDKVEHLKHIIECCFVDVLVTHAPPQGILDIGNIPANFGIKHLTQMFNNGLEQKLKAHLFGHVHQDAGVTYEWDMLLSNAATRVNRIEIR